MAGTSVCLLGESGSGKSWVAEAVLGEMQGYRIAIAAYNGSIKQTLTEIADQLQIPTTNENDRAMTADQLKIEIALNANSQTIICVDRAQRWAASLRYWLEGLQDKGCLLLLLAIEDTRKDVFLKCLKVELSQPSDLEIRELMVREAIAVGLELNPSRLAYLQGLAGSNLMLARKVVREAALGLHQQEGEHSQYLNVAPFVNAGLACLGIVRFIGLGLGDRSLYILGGVAMSVAIAARFLGNGLNQKPRRVGR